MPRKPELCLTPARAGFIRPANYDQHLDLLQECDIAIEAISERMDWKSDLYKKLAPHLGPHSFDDFSVPYVNRHVGD